MAGRKKSLEKEKRSKLGVIFDDIERSWSKFVIIGALLAAGFRFGMYYQETKMLRSETEMIKSHNHEIKELNDKWQERESLLRAEIDMLKEERSRLHLRLLKYEE